MFVENLECTRARVETIERLLRSGKNGSSCKVVTMPLYTMVLAESDGWYNPISRSLRLRSLNSARSRSSCLAPEVLSTKT